MTEIDLAEFNSREAAKFSYDGLLQARQRAHQLLLLLLGGGAGLGALGLERWGTSPALAGAALAASWFWFVLASRVAKRALQSQPVSAWTQPRLVKTFAEWERYSAELVREGKPPIDPLQELRRASLRMTDKSAEEYRAASTPTFVLVDETLHHLATTPFAALLGAGVGRLIQLFG